MSRHKRLAFALIGLTLVAAPIQAHSYDPATNHRIVVHFLLRHPNGHAVSSGTGYRPAQPVVGLWRPPSRDEVSQRSDDQSRRDLHDETVPLLEMEW